MQQVFNIFPLNSHALFFSNKRLKIRIIVSYKNNFRMADIFITINKACLEQEKFKCLQF